MLLKATCPLSFRFMMTPEGINAEVEFFKAQICASQADPKVD